MFLVRARRLTLFLSLAILLTLSCRKTDGNAISSRPAYTEGFDTATAAAERGWIFVNASIDKGRGKWDNPSSPPPFDPYSTQATNTGYLFADYQSTASTPGIISNWVLSPVGTFHNGDRIVFYTRAQILYYNLDSTDFANRLQVRFSRSGDSQDVGLGDKPGQFTTLLLDINPQYKPFLYSQFLSGIPESRLSYPHRWTRFELTLSGLDAPVTGRYAFRYYVEGGGANGRSSGIGLDQVSFFPLPAP